MNKLLELLKDYPIEQVEKYIAYCNKLKNEKDKKTGQLKNTWFAFLTENKLAELYRRVAGEGLVLDGEHITIQSTGLSYDYVAYKNKMLLTYPESLIDVALVREDDVFSFSKDAGSVYYSHTITNPFSPKVVIGGYCLIKNKRGEFLTLLSKADIDKHRKVAKTDFIWQQWFDEMAMKTLIKKACKQHFADVFTEIELSDNDNYNLENPLSLELKWKQEIDAIDTVEKLKAYYVANKGKGKDFDKYITIRNKQIHENS